MNSLQNLSEYGRRVIFALVIISSLALCAAAQKVEPQQQGKMYGDPGFRGEPIDLKVVNVDIRDVLSYITEQYGINFVIDSSVKSVPVTVNVRDVPWNVALDSILQAQDLAIQTNGSILRVVDAKKLATEQEIVRKNREGQLDVSPLYTEFIRLNYARASGTLPQGSPTSGTDSSNAAAQSGDSGQTAVGEGLLPIIKRRLSRRGSIETDGRSNSLIITDVRENIDAIRQLVSLLDQPEPQIEIEARIVVATRSFSRDVGVQLSGLVLGSRGSGGSLSTVGSTTAGGTGGTGGTGGGTGGAGGTTSGGALVPRGFPTGLGTTQPNGSLVSSIPNTVLGLTTGIFGTAQISLLLTAGEQRGQAKTIATPKVSTLNNRKAKIESKIQIPVLNAQPTGGGAIATTKYIDIPISLEITPQISDSGNVILKMLVENSSLAGGGTINSQNVETELMVPDGGTTVIGGVLSDDERESQDRTPGLSNIPLLGNLFKRKGVSRNTNELLFFITPRVYRPDAQGNMIPSTVNTGTRSTTILQPVPLGNPASNSDVPTNTSPNQQNQLVPVLPVVQSEGTKISPTKPNNN
jgi:type IV pilus assembly protein PilQ